MKRVIIFSIILAGSIMAYMVHGYASLNIENLKSAYIYESNIDSTQINDTVSNALAEVYRAKRTIARLPGIRALKLNELNMSMDHGGETLDKNTQLTIQEIYNALAMDVSISELYIVPLNIDPDRTDPTHQRPTGPIITFDHLIVGRTSIPTNIFSSTVYQEIEEIEIYEYRVMRAQLDMMQSICPTNEHIENLDYPAISSAPVITCDNSRYDPMNPNDALREGLVMSVPVFNNNGQLTGCVSIVMLADALADLLPTGDYAIINTQTGLVIPPNKPGQWESSKESAINALPDNSIIYSNVNPIKSKEQSSSWMLWSSHPDKQFWHRSDVQATQHARFISYIAVAILTFIAIISTLLIARAYDRLAMTNQGLEAAVEKRTQQARAARDLAITALDREQETITELEYQKQALDQHAIVSMTDISGKIIYANNKFCEISGYTQEELIGNTHQVVKSDEHATDLYQELWRTISSGNVWQGEIKNETKDGGYYWVDATIVPFKDANGNINKYVAIRSDITDRKDYDQMIKESNATLSKALESEKRIKSRLERTMDKLEVLASTDKLTGLPNRTVFAERLEKAVKHANEHNSKFAVLFFDFDRFKMINDSLGHDVGDMLLCSIADIFRSLLREQDTIARFGGDEFVVLLDDITDWNDAEHVADKLLKAFAKPHTLKEHLVVSTASIGLVTNQHDLSSPTELIRDADAAMYQAKSNGKNRVVVFDIKMHEDAMESLSLELDLRKALDLNQLYLVYQPIMELSTGSLKGFEALIRWEHPTKGIISPEKFIPIAEETGLINKIGQWVFNQAAQSARDWNNDFSTQSTLTVNVNVSKRQLLDPMFLNNALECKSKFDLNDAQLQIEITESTIVDARANVIPILTQLRDHGFPIVMDDFGTGVSSLSTLHAFPIDVLKIDQSFIKVLSGDRSLLAVVSSITNLAQNLGIQTVAEGVESEEIVAALQSIDCTWGQGYYFAKPLSIQEARDFIAKCTQNQQEAA